MMPGCASRLLPVVAMLLAMVPAVAADLAEALVEDLARAAPAVNREVIGLAVQSLQCASRTTGELPEKLALIDYSRPSTATRLWVFDLRRRTLNFAERVAHGQASGDNLTTRFSNEPGSRQTSLGLFRTSETYRGRNGYSLRLDGLEPGFNDRARERAIVIHGAPYVSEGTVQRLGRLGRSWGCPAVQSQVAQSLIDDIKGGQYVFAYYPDPRWLKRSHLLACPPARSAATVATGTSPAG